MPQYITDINVSLNKTEEDLLNDEGFIQIQKNLNAGAGGKEIYLWYKMGDCQPVTRIQFSFSTEMGKALNDVGYTKVEKNLNDGVCRGNEIYLWFFKGTTDNDVKIVELDVSMDGQDDAKKAQPFWERSACDLNRGAGGNWIYLWMKRENQPYICDITATDKFSDHANLFRQGYIRVDEITNRDAGGAWVFIWYRQSTDISKAIKDLKISTTPEEIDGYKKQHYQPVKTNLNEGGCGCGNEVYLWYKNKDCSQNPIKMVSLLLDTSAVKMYEENGIEVIKKNINQNGQSEYLCFDQSIYPSEQAQ